MKLSKIHQRVLQGGFKVGELAIISGGDKQDGGQSMKAYGHSRRDKLECEYGCCTWKSGKNKGCRDAVDRANRKTARQEGKVQIKEETAEERAKRELGFPMKDQGR